MYTGTGDANTDIGAHLMGFLCGFVGGMLLTLVRDKLTQKHWQRTGATLALLIVATAWTVAFLS
jgi:membrane associated rhomboid family serine protease